MAHHPRERWQIFLRRRIVNHELHDITDLERLHVTTEFHVQALAAGHRPGIESGFELEVGREGVRFAIVGPDLSFGSRHGGKHSAPPQPTTRLPAGRRGYLRGMSEDRSYIDENSRERERLRVLVERLGEDELRALVNEYWTVAAVFGHIAFWDARVLSLADKLERGEPFSPSDAEPEDVDWINDASRALIHAVPPQELARLSLQIAEETDARVATLPLDRLWPRDPGSPLEAVRASHRGEHLDEVEAALSARHGPP